MVRRDLAETLNLVGSLQANESAEIRAELGGLVRAIYFEEGQRVKAGEILLKIDDAELQAQYAQVEARFKLAELNVARSESLSETRTIPQSEFDRARSEYASTQAERSLLRLRLEKTEIKAPFDGIVGSRTISPGDYVTPSTVITRLDDLSRLKIGFQVPERFLSKVHPGTVVRATTRVSGLTQVDKTISGEVYFVGSTIDRSTRASEVKAILRDPASELRPGMFANIELELDVRTQVLAVPEGAILADARGVQIIVVDQKKDGAVAQYVPVVTGLRTRGLVEIKPVDGELKEGVPVVASGVGALILFPGAPLAPKPLRSQFGINP
ncbi:MAG: efflux RND transporter periplasmic adaptor subunit [Opitutaceae bacterium]|nr:efflux RND transporter periplasmic adaptor subunit [Opitutaceae bacterium]